MVAALSIVPLFVYHIINVLWHFKFTDSKYCNGSSSLFNPDTFCFVSKFIHLEVEL